ncbi:MAG TPA: ATP-binding protein [Firmicutes bacterium]|jgi:anti-sigma regulatory factor (Ser/Thr protein kinase)|nr:ATP-binding protein [Bacillota bacterium]HOQ24392.1 ATP-binding protein [Bacillota bacterium]HPT67701.1 ATP-binding protein [Bacillota bacterium]
MVKLWLQVEIPAGGDSRKKLCLFVAQALKIPDLSENDRFVIRLLTDEALENALVAAAEVAPEATVSFSLQLTEEKFTLVVENPAKPCFPEGQALKRRDILAKDLSLFAERGRGLRILAKYAQGLNIRQQDNRVVTRLWVGLEGRRETDHDKSSR